MDPSSLEIVAVADFGLGVQAWAGQTPPEAARLTRPAWTRGPVPKPVDGFFTSSWDSIRRSSAWLDYPKDEQRTGEYRILWTLIPNPDAMLYIIDTRADYQRLADAYPKRWDGEVTNRLYAPDWRSVADLPVDGVHATAGAAAGIEDPDGGLVPFRGWAVESTLWFVWRFSRQERVGRIVDVRTPHGYIGRVQ